MDDHELDKLTKLIAEQIPEPVFSLDEELPSTFFQEKLDWFQRALGEWDLYAKEMEQAKGLHPFDLVLAEYFQHERWKLKEAWLLLAGISPSPALVDWDFEIENYQGAPMGRIKLQQVYLIKFMDLSEGCSERIQEGEHNFSAQEAVEWNKKVDKHDFVMERYRNKLEKIVDLWERTKHPESSIHSAEPFGGDHRSALVDISYVVHWALSKDLEIEWLDWATRRGYLDNKAICGADTSSSSSEKEKRYLYKTIGLFSKALAASASKYRKGDGSPNAAQIVAHLEKFMPNDEAGLSNKVLRERVARGFALIDDS